MLYDTVRDKWCFVRLILLLTFMLAALPAMAAETGDAEKTKGETHEMGQVVVTATKAKEEIGANVGLTPAMESIDLDQYEAIALPQNIGDYLQNLVLFDYRDNTNLVPGSDSFYMRSFAMNRFTMAVDGLDLRKTGGRNHSNIVDFATLPPFLVKRIEVLPGPHWALYPAKSIGGVVNLVSRAPQLQASPVPSLKASGSYRSYNTQNYNLSLRGSAGQFTYDAGYQFYKTDGYLRNTAAEVQTGVGRAGYVIPSGGHIALTASYTSNERRDAVVNDPSRPDYDPDYPDVSIESRPRTIDQDPSWDGDCKRLRLDYLQPWTIGEVSLEAYYGEEYKDRAYKSNGGYTHFFTRWYQTGAKLQDKYKWNASNVTFFELDGQQAWDGGEDRDDKNKRLRIFGAGLQHEWTITPRLKLTLGLRYEHDTIWVSNNYITTEGEWIQRNFDGLMPKSFLTYEMDDLAAWLRDTSVSLGVSRIWHAPDFHGSYNPQGRPTGAYLDPEQGVGMDAILQRRLWGNVQMKLDFYYYVINDYMAYNRSYAKNTPSKSNPVTPGQEYSDYMLNLEQMISKGVDVELSGNITEKLSFYLGYAYLDMENQGDELAGIDAAADQAKHRVKAGLRFEVIKGTTLLLDYKFQDKQVSEYSEEIAEDEWVVRRVAIDAHSLVDLGLRQKLFEKWGFAKDAYLNFFVNNAFNTDYEDNRGYPATDRTFGVSLSFGI
jgi:outer membrane receptor protein involved in Fe transport